MKIYSNINLETFTNCYLVADEASGKAIVIDPGSVSTQFISRIEENNLSLTAVLVTHNHPGHTKGLPTLRKIYDVAVYAADLDVAGSPASVIKGDGNVRIAGLNVSYFSLPGHSSDSMVYKIGNILFTGDTIEAGTIGSTNSSYAKQTLATGIRSKILSQFEDTIIMPGHGPMTSVGAEKMFNIDLVPMPKSIYHFPWLKPLS